MKTLFLVALYIIGALGLSLVIFSATLRDHILQKSKQLKDRIIQKSIKSRYPSNEKNSNKRPKALANSFFSIRVNRFKSRLEKKQFDDEENLLILPFWHGDQKKYVSLLMAVIVLVITPVIWVSSRNNHDSLEIEDLNNNYADIENPQIHALLIGEQLTPPAPPPEALFDQLQQELTAMQQQAPITTSPTVSTNTNPFEGLTTAITPFKSDNATPVEATVETQSVAEIKSADRKWERMNSQYVQRLLVVFKLMKEKYGYDMVLLEGYRSPDRQNRLAAMGSNVTKATGFRSYHQFGVAADCAFIRNGKIVISERDPWAMEGYRKYGEVAESVGLTWGGRWKMMDLGHTELRIKGILGNAALAQQMTSGS